MLSGGLVLGDRDPMVSGLGDQDRMVSGLGDRDWMMNELIGDQDLMLS